MFFLNTWNKSSYHLQFESENVEVYRVYITYLLFFYFEINFANIYAHICMHAITIKKVVMELMESGEGDMRV